MPPMWMTLTLLTSNSRATRAEWVTTVRLQRDFRWGMIWKEVVLLSMKMVSKAPAKKAHAAPAAGAEQKKAPEKKK